ncbi:unnamed protein product [marine sediment metagenome]|uniref:Uncharacterized protein n=1 Tax=marine sediment metagenome TaxID=412755 RepID=X0ZET6_9ZZZZ
MSKKYLGDKYVKAYQFFRDKEEEKIRANTQRIAELERMIEWLCAYIVEGKK